MKKGTERDWSVYILRCGDGTLYTGIAKDVAARLKQHGRGKGAAYTRTRLPLALLYQRPRLTRSQALVREIKIKRLPRTAKEKLINKSSPKPASFTPPRGDRANTPAPTAPHSRILRPAATRRAQAPAKFS
ncbi:MAG: GIY-YIG nuclease family protein [Elusimicrobia bacterium]|nr:GIY-YIG nuclease family protein [Elusimicrobiota bacterium]